MILLICCFLYYVGCIDKFKGTLNENIIYDGTFTQKLDHFNPDEKRTFKQYYFLSNKYWKNNSCPILYHINGESGCSGNPGWLNEYAESLNALIVTVEHRFYGRSCPFDRSHLDTKDLVFLSAKQAIEDLAYFRSNCPFPIGKDNKWIVVGGSYSGAMSAWAKLKHPDIYDAAWSSSGVVNTIYNFPQFDEHTAVAAGDVCANYLRNVTHQLDVLMSDPKTKKETLRRFEIEGDMENGDFFYFVADVGAETMQYGHKYHLCDKFDPKTNPLDVFIKYYLDYARYHLGSASGYKIDVILRKDNNANRMWWWQKCNEVAFFQVAPEKDSIRSKTVDLNYHLDRCKRAYGIENTEERVEETLKYFEGLKILNKTTKIIFLNGSQDPWQRATVIGPDSNDDKNVVHMTTCKNCGHCVEQYSCPDGCDPIQPYLDAKALVKKTLADWIK